MAALIRDAWCRFRVIINLITPVDTNEGLSNDNEIIIHDENKSVFSIVHINSLSFTEAPFQKFLAKKKMTRLAETIPEFVNNVGIHLHTIDFVTGLPCYIGIF